MCGLKILCEISKGSFEISHKIWNPYTAKYSFIVFFSCVWVTISLRCDVISLSETGPSTLMRHETEPSWYVLFAFDVYYFVSRNFLLFLAYGTRTYKKLLWNVLFAFDISYFVSRNFVSFLTYGAHTYKKTMINRFIPDCNVIYSSWKNYVSYLLSGKIIVSHILRWFFFDTPLFMLSRMICFRSVDGNRNKKRETDAYYLRYNVYPCNHAPVFYRARWLVKVTRHV